MDNRTNGAAMLASEIRNGALKSSDVLDRCLSVTAAREDETRAFTHLDPASCRRAAIAASGPLGGLPIGVKDIIDTHDFETEMGSAIYRGRRPDSDAPIVTMIRRAGGAVLGKTVTTEFAATFPGPTTNPHNVNHTPGGSSSGSAAAVAAGMVPLAIGSQTAGSIVRPAAFCGVAGYKPSFGMFPTAGVKLMSWSLDTLGFFGQGIPDVSFFASAVAGYAITRRKERPPRYGLLETSRWPQISPDMHDAVAAAVRRATLCGASFSHVAVPDFYASADGAHNTIQNYEIARALAFEFDHHAGLLSPGLKTIIEDGLAIAPEEYVIAQQTALQARGASGVLFEGVDALLLPSAPGAAPQGLAYTGDSTLCRVWTLLGFACVNVPGFRDKTGMPLGLQIVAPWGRDDDALWAAEFLEDAINAGADA